MFKFIARQSTGLHNSLLLVGVCLEPVEMFVITEAIIHTVYIILYVFFL